MLLGIIRCMQTEDFCPGTADFGAIRDREGVFEGITEDKNCTRMELFLFAMSLGIDSGIETNLMKTDTLVRGEYINTKHEAYLYSTFIYEISDEGELDNISDINQVYGKAQRYANTGFKLIDDMLEKSESIVQLELLQELNDMYDKYINI